MLEGHNGRIITDTKDLPGLEPGDKVVSGRLVWRHVVDVVCALPPNVEKFAGALQAAIDTSPLQVMKEFVMPLLPKEIEASEHAQQVDLKIELVPKAESNDNPNINSNSGEK